MEIRNLNKGVQKVKRFWLLTIAIDIELDFSNLMGI